VGDLPPSHIHFSGVHSVGLNELESVWSLTAVPYFPGPRSASAAEFIHQALNVLHVLVKCSDCCYLKAKPSVLHRVIIRA